MKAEAYNMGVLDLLPYTNYPCYPKIIWKELSLICTINLLNDHFCRNHLIRNHEIYCLKKLIIREIDRSKVSLKESDQPFINILENILKILTCGKK